MDDLMVLANKTGGIVARVDPNSLDKDLDDVLKDEVFSKEAQMSI